MAASLICKGCWCQMRVPVPIGGPLSLPFRLFGIRRSRMNPNLCTVCELMFRFVMRRRNVEAELTILFADLRGYTALSQTLDAGRVHELLDVFYEECAGAIWEHDGLLNKTIGDAVMAVFNFPITRPDHARQAVAAARDPAALRGEGGGPGGPGLRPGGARGRRRGPHRDRVLRRVRPGAQGLHRDRRHGEPRRAAAGGSAARRGAGERRGLREVRRRERGCARAGVPAQGLRRAGDRLPDVIGIPVRRADAGDRPHRPKPKAINVDRLVHLENIPF
jgi:Adenylate and Guanylate cyclase catalytic domain